MNSDAIIDGPIIDGPELDIILNQGSQFVISQIKRAPIHGNVVNSVGLIAGDFCQLLPRKEKFHFLLFFFCG